MRATRAVVTAVVLAAGTTRAADPVVLDGHTKAVTTVAWSADGKALATAGDDRSIRVWNPATGKQTGALPQVARDGYGGPVVAFTADLKTAAVNYWGEITILAVADGRPLATIDPILDRGQKSAFRPDVFAMAFRPDGRRLATAGSTAAVGGRHGLPGGVVLVWDVKTGQTVHRSDRLSTAAGAVAWSGDGKRLAAGTNGAGGELPEAGEVRVWDADTGKGLHEYRVRPAVDPGQWASARDVAFGPAGGRVAAAVAAGGRAAPAGLRIDDAGASVRLWELGSGRSALPVKGVPGSVRRLAFRPDGRRLATAGGDAVVRVWDAETGKEVAARTGPDVVTAVAFSPDGRRLAAGCKDGAVRVWPLPADE